MIEMGQPSEARPQRMFLCTVHLRCVTFEQMFKCSVPLEVPKSNKIKDRISACDFVEIQQPCTSIFADKDVVVLKIRMQ